MNKLSNKKTLLQKKLKIIRVTTKPEALQVLLKDQLKFINNFHNVIGLSSPGKELHNVKIKVSDLDAGTPLVLDVGDDGDVDRVRDGSTVGRAGGTDHEDANGAPQVYTADNTVDILCTVAPGTDVATGTLEMWVYVS